MFAVYDQRASSGTAYRVASTGQRDKLEPARKEPSVPRPERLLYKHYNIKETIQVIRDVNGRVYHSHAVEQGMQAWRLPTRSPAAGMRCLPGRLDRIACRWRSSLR